MNHLLPKVPWGVGTVPSFLPGAIRRIEYFSNAILLKICLSFILLFVSMTPAFAGSVNLSWDANTEPDLAGYKVYFGTSSGNYGTPASVGNTTSYSLAGLSDGTYFFAVTAIAH